MDDNTSYLTLFWAIQTSIIGASCIYLILLKTYRDKNHGCKAADEKRSWYEFKKRPFQLAFFSFLWVLYLSYTTVSSYCWGHEANGHLTDFLDYITHPKQVVSDYISTVIAMSFFLIHLGRRVYESWSVCIFSGRQVLNPITVILSYTFYIGAGLSLISASPPLSELKSCLSSEGFSLRHVLALPLFFFASKIQHETFKSLAQLRRNKAGHIVTTEYKMPKGGWFEYCSSPHYTAEVVIYAAIGLTIGLNNTTWWWLVSYVFTNQFYLAYNSQQYYEEKFPEYPKSRAMLIPYLL